MNDQPRPVGPGSQDGFSEILAKHDSELFLALEQGDPIEAWDKTGVRWQGAIDLIDQARGFLWIHTQIGERKLLDIQEHTIRRIYPL